MLIFCIKIINCEEILFNDVSTQPTNMSLKIVTTGNNFETFL